MRILIVKLSSIGDIVHTLPALAVLRSGMPDAEISWVVEAGCAKILEDNPLLNRLIEVDTKALRRGLMSGETLRAPRQQLRRLRASAFDVALDFQGLIKSSLIARLSGARRIFGYSRQALREPASRFLLSNTVDIPDRTHVIRKNLELLRQALNLQVPERVEDFAFPIHIDKQDEIEAERAVALTRGKYAILNPGGGWPTKLWGPQRFGNLADALWSHYGFESLVTHGPGEENLADEVLRSCGSGKAQKVSLPLKAFYCLARSSKVYVGGDTGPTHLAVAAGAPIVGLFGPTEWWRNGSPSPHDVCVERNDIDCRENCHRRSCSKWICMEINVERVLEAIDRRLRTVNSKSAARILPLAG